MAWHTTTRGNMKGSSWVLTQKQCVIWKAVPQRGMTVAWTRVRRLETVRNDHFSWGILKTESTEFGCGFCMGCERMKSRGQLSCSCLHSHSDGNRWRTGWMESLVVGALNSGVGEVFK